MRKTILITGASSGLGNELAKQFARRGYNLALSARRLNLLESLKQELQDSRIQIACWACDVTVESDVKSMFHSAVESFGSIDVVVVNAGIAELGNVGEQDFQRMKAIIDVNLTAAMGTANTALPILRKQGYGQIVFMASIAGVRGLPNMGAYSASKSGIMHFAESLRGETYFENIQVTVLCPGYIETELGEGMDKLPFVIDADKGGNILAKLIEKKVKLAYAPFWPWAIFGRMLPLIPLRFLAKRS